MIFNSIDFFVFLVTVFFLYWFVFNRNRRVQNWLLLVASYVFYGWWDWRFLSLIIISTGVDFWAGLKIYHARENKQKRLFLGLSILCNLGLLGFFKYFNFFIDSWVGLLDSFGYGLESTWTLNIILPVGISFYTFQTMSYSIDIYRGKLQPTKDLASFAAFVAFFPQLVAGPIERASNLLPQIMKPRAFDYHQGVQGLRLILWGMFKKVVIADSLAPYVDDIFSNYQHLDGGVLILGAVYFGIQIYCDFSGYSDIAIGTAKLFGFELMSNFRFPYFSRDIAEFWRRWHISLSTWFRDYLYIPLGGSKTGAWQSLRNIFIIFVVSGFWHGANWTFIVWGGIHSMLYIPLFLAGKNRKYLSSVAAAENTFPSLTELAQMLVTFSFVTLAWIFFRSETVTDAYMYTERAFREIAFPGQYRSALLYCAGLLLMDWFFRRDERNIYFNNIFLRYGFYYSATLMVIFFLKGSKSIDFIYFQF